MTPVYGTTVRISGGRIAGRTPWIAGAVTAGILRGILRIPGAIIEVIYREILKSAMPGVS